MTDTTATTNTALFLPEEAWGLIASFLDNDDLARFKQVRPLFNHIGSHAGALQPLYNRLYAMDKTLPADLPQEGTAIFFKQAFEKIQARQQQEIAYLTQHHPAVMAKDEYAQAIQQNKSVSLKSLEAKNTLLDAINSNIITSKIIDINSAFLNLNQQRITRLPVTLFQAEGYVNFWKNLTSLDCDNNQLTELNVQGLVALQRLECDNNQLTALDVQGLVALQQLGCCNNQLTALNVHGLVALQELWCKNNQLTALNVQGLVALQYLWCNNNHLTELNVQGLAGLRELGCNNNPLIDLNLTGIPAVTRSEYEELEKTLLFKQLSPSNSVEARREIIARLGTDYTYENCLHYCGPVYATKIFITDALPFVSIYLPSASASNNAPNAQQKRSREEGQEQDDNQMDQEENQTPSQERKPGDEPETKRRKKS